jgi:hypothetical protein
MGYRHNLNGMSDAEHDALRHQPRRCNGACGLMLTFDDFEITTERGRKVYRRQCRGCMAAYYTTRQKAGRKRTQRRIAELIAREGPCELAKIARHLRLSKTLTLRFLECDWFDREAERWYVSNEARAKVMA